LLLKLLKRCTLTTKLAIYRYSLTLIFKSVKFILEKELTLAYFTIKLILISIII
jgi:hypothetical protein